MYDSCGRTIQSDGAANAYDQLGRLKRATYPDRTYATFYYDEEARIQAFCDSFFSRRSDVRFIKDAYYGVPLAYDLMSYTCASFVSDALAAGGLELPIKYPNPLDVESQLIGMQFWCVELPRFFGENVGDVIVNRTRYLRDQLKGRWHGVTRPKEPMRFLLVLLGCLTPFLWLVCRAVDLSVSLEYSIYEPEQRRVILERYVQMLEQYGIIACIAMPISVALLPRVFARLAHDRPGVTAAGALRDGALVCLINSLILLLFYVLAVRVRR